MYSLHSACSSFVVVLFLHTLVLLLHFSNASDTTCEESEKHFANLCFTPKPVSRNDLYSETGVQHNEFSNDIFRLHFSEVMKGKLLTLQDNFDDSCFKAQVEHSENSFVDGTVFGYGDLSAKFNCSFTKDFPGVLACDMVTAGPSKFHEIFNWYVSYTDNKNLQIAITCFPMGQVGWSALSVSETLTDAEMKTIREHVKSLGFSDDNTVATYVQRCDKK